MEGHPEVFHSVTEIREMLRVSRQWVHRLIHDALDFPSSWPSARSVESGSQATSWDGWSAQVGK